MIHLAEIAQLVEHSTENAGVPSSSLGLGTFSFFRHRGSGVEQLTRNEQVVGSNPTGGYLGTARKSGFFVA